MSKVFLPIAAAAMVVCATSAQASLIKNKPAEGNKDPNVWTQQQRDECVRDTHRIGVRIIVVDGIAVRVEVPPVANLMGEDFVNFLCNTKPQP